MNIFPTPPFRSTDSAKVRCLGFASLFLIASSAALAQIVLPANNLLTNGGFEGANVSAYNGALYPVGYPLGGAQSVSTTKPGWTVTNNANYVSNYDGIITLDNYAPTLGANKVVEGTRSIGFNGGFGLDAGDLSVCQTVNNLIVGATYELSFYQGAVNGYLAGDINWTVQFGNETQTSPLMHTTTTGIYYPNDPTGSTKYWSIVDQPVVMTFTATSASQDLCFLNSPLGSPVGLILDAASLTLVSVPEPSAFALMGVALIFGVGARRRR